MQYQYHKISQDITISQFDKDQMCDKATFTATAIYHPCHAEMTSPSLSLLAVRSICLSLSYVTRKVSDCYDSIRETI